MEHQTEQPAKLNISRFMDDMAKLLNSVLNNEQPKPKYGYALMIFPLNTTAPGVHFGSNAKPGDMTKALRELADNLEAEPAIQNPTIQ